jgi:hypothetical protein
MVPAPRAPPAQAPAGAAASSADLGGGAAPPVAASARRWKYLGAASDGGGNSTKLAITLVELRQGEIDGHPVIELALEVDGKRIGADGLTDKGLAFAPFRVLGSRLLLAGARHGKGDGLWLIEGDGELDASEVGKALADAPSIRVSKALPLRERMPSPRGDRAFLYRRQIGRWMAYCTGFFHPAPETGDTFESERCYAPGAGLIRFSFSSVWGGYSLELSSTPAEDTPLLR